MSVTILTADEAKAADDLAVSRSNALDAREAAVEAKETALEARIAKLEATQPVAPPVVLVESPDNTRILATTAGAFLVDAAHAKWTIVAGQCAVNGTPDTSTASVVGLLIHSHAVTQWNTSGNFYTGTPGKWTQVPGDPTLPPKLASTFTVTKAAGFTDLTGKPWTMKGLNAGVQDALTGFANVLIDYPGLNTIRLNTGGNDAAADIDKVVQEYTARGVVVMIEDHSGNPNNVAWYTQMASTYKTNPRVFLEMPNEPNPTNLSAIQIGLVQAIRAAGFTGPVSLQPAGGYDFSNIGPVVTAVGTTNIFVTPHIYYSGTDPNGATQYVANDISTSLGLGLFPAIDEFGDAMDGWHRDMFGPQVISAMIAANQSGKAGAVFWAMDNGNHPDGADSAFLKPDGSQLTPVGLNIKPWLS